MRWGLALGLVLLSTPAAAAEKQLKPFVGVTFGTITTLVDLDSVYTPPATGGSAAGKKNVVIGVGAAMLGDIVGLDVDVAYAPGFFQGEQGLVLASSVTTVTGNVVVGLPRRKTEYTLRPYFVGGAGVMRARIDDYFGALKVAEMLAALDVGGGATGFVTNRWGLCWDLRYFRSFSREGRGVSIGREQLSFWRASMAVVIR